MQRIQLPCFVIKKYLFYTRNQFTVFRTYTLIFMYHLLLLKHFILYIFFFFFFFIEEKRISIYKTTLLKLRDHRKLFRGKFEKKINFFFLRVSLKLDNQRIKFNTHSLMYVLNIKKKKNFVY